MITLRTLRERTGMSQKQLADVVGVSQQLISQVERGEHALDVGHRLVTKMAHAFSTTPASVVNANERVRQVATAVKEIKARSDWSPDEAVEFARRLQELAEDRSIPDAVRKEAERTLGKLAPSLAAAVKQSSQTIGQIANRPLVIVPGQNLDPDVDLQSLRVAVNGEGNFIVVDSQGNEVDATVQFGDVVQQQGTPAGNKSKGMPSHRDAVGRAIKSKRKSNRDALGRRKAKKNG